MQSIENLIWYRIPGYNGYEYNYENKIVRSIKNYKVNPIGKLIKKYNDTNGDFYYMSDSKNIRQKVYISNIETLIDNDPRKVKVSTYTTNLSPRNIVTRNKHARSKPNDPDSETYFPTFDSMIIDDK